LPCRWTASAISIELDDRHIVAPGAVGVWTEADSVTAFDDFAYGTTRP
jgi:hypothetical protein